jgi:hypothetical protein
MFAHVAEFGRRLASVHECGVADPFKFFGAGKRLLREAVVLGFNVALWIGLLSDYRRPFWRAVRHALSRGQVDAALGARCKIKEGVGCRSIRRQGGTL